MFSIQSNIPTHVKKQEVGAHNLKERNRLWDESEWADWNFIIAAVNMFKDLKENVNMVMEDRRNLSRETGTIKKE